MRPAWRLAALVSCLLSAPPLCEGFNYAPFQAWVSYAKAEDAKGLSCCIGLGCEFYQRYTLAGSPSGPSVTEKSPKLSCYLFGSAEENGEWAKLTGTLQDDTVYLKATVEGWEEDDVLGRCANKGDCVPTLRGGTPSYPGSVQTTTVECKPQQGYHTTRLSWQWWPVNCKGAIAEGFDSRCSDVTPGGTCTVGCDTGYQPVGATTGTYYCNAKNTYEGNNATPVGAGLVCVKNPTVSPTASPSVPPSAAPHAPPTRSPTSPTRAPTVGPSTGAPSVAPSLPPSAAPTRSPVTVAPSAAPTRPPTGVPSAPPSREPTKHPLHFGDPSESPRIPPTHAPSARPSASPSVPPSPSPSLRPSKAPSLPPSVRPSGAPSGSPSARPTAPPTTSPASSPPTRAPSRPPSVGPSHSPSVPPTMGPSAPPTTTPTRHPEAAPTTQPSRRPSVPPSRRPSAPPSRPPSARPSARPSALPTAQPTEPPQPAPTVAPAAAPTHTPSTPGPSTAPTPAPSKAPSRPPTASTQSPSAPPVTAAPTAPGETAVPSVAPTVPAPTRAPSMLGATSPPSLPPTTRAPTTAPTTVPTAAPSRAPSRPPRAEATNAPSRPPTLLPTAGEPPSVSPTASPEVLDAVATTITEVSVGTMQASALLLLDVGGAAQATRLGVLAIGCERRSGSDTKKKSPLPRSIHPTGLELDGFVFPAHVGCVVANAALAGGIGLAALCVARLLQRATAKDRWEAEGTARFPSLPTLVLSMLSQGAAYAAVNLMRFAEGFQDVLLGVVACAWALGMPLVLYRAGRRSQPQAAYKKDLENLRHGPALYWFGQGEWLSLQRSRVERWSIAFRETKRMLYWVISLDVFLSVLAAISGGVWGGSCRGCGVMRLLDAAISLFFVLVLLWYRPFVRPPRMPGVIAAQLFQAAAALALAYGYFSEGCDDGADPLPGHRFAAPLLAVAGVSSLFVALVSASAALRGTLTGRGAKLRESLTRFTALDTDGNGTLSREELKSGLEAELGRQLPWDEFNRVFDRVDADGTNTVDLHEFLENEDLFARIPSVAKSDSVIRETPNPLLLSPDAEVLPPLAEHSTFSTRPHDLINVRVGVLSDAGTFSPVASSAGRVRRGQLSRSPGLPPSVLSLGGGARRSTSYRRLSAQGSSSHLSAKGTPPLRSHRSAETLSLDDLLGGEYSAFDALDDAVLSKSVQGLKPRRRRKQQQAAKRDADHTNHSHSPRKSARPHIAQGSSTLLADGPPQSPTIGAGGSV